MDRDTIENVQLGIFVIIGMILFIVGIFLIGRHQTLFLDTIDIHTHFRNVSGLTRGHNVLFAGLNIGTVSNVSIVNDTTVRVDMRIQADAAGNIREDAIATLGTEGIMGNRTVEIKPGTAGLPSLKDGDQIRSEPPLDFGEIINTMQSAAQEAEKVSVAAAEIFDRLRKGEGLAGRLLMDDEIADDVQVSIKNLRQGSSELNRKVEALDPVIQNAHTASKKAVDLIGEAEQSINNANSITTDGAFIMNNIRNGEGMAGKLVADTAMAKSFNRSIIFLEEGSKAFNENMQVMQRMWPFRRHFRNKE
jgi:phospholipid/cholesterol/gamma-HCH transport system substrate-binding protein